MTADILQLLNIIVIPCLIYIIKIEKRITKIETMLEMKRKGEGKRHG